MKTRQSDPSQTANIRARYEREAVRRFTVVRKLVNTAVDTRDVMGLRNPSLRIAEPQPPFERQFATAPAAQRVDLFAQWLRSIIEEAIVSGRDLVGPPAPGAWQRPFLRAAYFHGVTSAATDLRRQGESVPENISSGIMQSPFHRTRLESLFARNLTELKGVTEAMATAIQRELADALLSGRNPRETARRIRLKVDAIGIRRARLIARTETVRANAEAALSTFEQFGQRQVRLEAEFLTAGDNRVCPQCQALSGKVFSITEARGVIPQHPACRCDWLPLERPAKQVA